MSALLLEATPDANPLTAFAGEIETVKVSQLYRLGLFIVALAMILLPLVYVALIFGAGYGVYYHAVNDTAILSGSGSGIWRLLIYLTPIVVGGILVLFMIKPLFVSVQRPVPLVALERAQEPLLFEFIAKICAAVRAPMPSAINVNCEVNAYASFARNAFSFWTNDLNLTIGLPLVYGMRMNQLAGIFAHEFGHFAQGTGMRLTYLIRNVNLWFARVVYERDAWDDKLVQWSQEADFRIAIILHIARFFVWVTRKILWALMMAGHFLSSFMLRQMEYDADRYEARLAGSETFALTVRQLRRLNAAQYGAFAYLNEMWKDGRLANDLPAFIATKLEKLPVDFTRQDEEHLAKTKTGLFDTHPADQDRIASAAREQAQGLFRLDAPATALFQNLDNISRRASQAHYQLLLGNAVSENNLISNDEFLQRQQRLDADHDAAARYFQNMLMLTRPLAVSQGDISTPVSAEDLIQNLRAVRARILEQLPEAARAWESYEAGKIRKLQKLENDLLEALRIQPTNGARVVADAPSLKDPMWQNHAIEVLQKLEGEMHARLAAVLGLLQHQDFSGKLDEGQAKRDEIAALLPALEKFDAVIEELRQFHEEFVRMNVILLHAARLNNDRDDYHIVNRTITTAHALQNKILQLLAQADYPFDHTKGRMTLAQYALPSPAAGPEFHAVFAAYQELSEKLFSFYFRAMGRVAVIAEQVETAAGLEPLPMPEPLVNSNAQNEAQV